MLEQHEMKGSDISDDELARLRRKLEDHHLPEREVVPNSCASWDYGVSLDWVKAHRDVWLNDFDWRDVERELNRHADRSLSTCC